MGIRGHTPRQRPRPLSYGAIVLIDNICYLYMPVVYRIYGFLFHFFSNEHEPIHVHVKGNGGVARFKLVPEIKLTYNKGYKPKDLKIIEKELNRRRSLIIKAWHKHFNQ